MILQANLNDIETVLMLTQRTIEKIYPHYYPRGAVNFFLQHHCRAAVERDVFMKNVYIYRGENDEPIGTVTVNENEMNRLFVNPLFQGKGYGSELIEFAENKIFEKYSEVILSASLPAKAIYLAKGYRIMDYHKILTDNGDFLCYDEMCKNKENL